MREDNKRESQNVLEKGVAETKMMPERNQIGVSCSQFLQGWAS